jgi:hypothetical protein
MSANQNQLAKMNDTLGLPKTFRPATRISQIFNQMTTRDIIACLRPLTDEDAQFICAHYDRLSAPLQRITTIDFLIAACKCKDPHSIAGLITTSYSRLKAMETQMVAAEASPGIMKDVAERAKRKGGFHHAKLALQITGVAPVPKNQFTVNNIRGNVDASTNNTINVAAHHEAVNEVSEILGKMTVINVQPNQDRGENQGD